MQQVYNERMPLWRPFADSFVATTTVGAQVNNLFLVNTGTGTTTYTLSGETLTIAITANTANRVSEAKYFSTGDAGIDKIQVKPNTAYTMRCSIRVTASAATPTGATVRLLELNHAGVQVGSVNSPTTLVTAIQDFTETVLNFTTGALTRELHPIFSVNGGATGTITAQFRDFQLYETL